MIPVNEMGVVVLFAQQDLFKIVSIQAEFPDAIVELDDVQYRVEFEFRASNFKNHRHDIRKCDLIICWENDWPNCILPVLALATDTWQIVPLELPSKSDRDIAYWKERALQAERRLSRFAQEDARKDCVNDKPLGHLPVSNQARAILETEPGISGSELGRRLQVSPGWGRKLKRQIGANGKAAGQAQILDSLGNL